MMMYFKAFFALSFAIVALAVASTNPRMMGGMRTFCSTLVLCRADQTNVDHHDCPGDYCEDAP